MRPQTTCSTRPEKRDLDRHRDNRGEKARMNVGYLPRPFNRQPRRISTTSRTHY